MFVCWLVVVFLVFLAVAFLVKNSLFWNYKKWILATDQQGNVDYVLLPPCPASLTYKNSRGGRIVDGLPQFWDATIDQLIDLKMYLKNAMFARFFKGILNATSRQKSNIVRS